jgi:hypothetical protein
MLIRPGALGDAIVSLPLVAALNGVVSDGVDILGRPASWRFLPPGPLSPRVHDINALGWLGLFAERPLAAEAAAVLAWADRVVAVVGAGSPLLDGLARAGGADVLRIDPPRLEDRARSADDLAAARLLRPWLQCAPAQSPEPIEALISAWLTPSATELAAAERDLDRALPDRPRLALHPGSGSPAKCWQGERFGRTIRCFIEAGGGGVLLLAGPADEEALVRLRAALPGEVRWLASVDEAPRRVAALASRCDVFLGNDSGLAHLVAPHVPAVVLFGPTDPGVWRPRGPEVRVLRAPDGHMASLAVEPVVAALSAAMSASLAQSRPRSPSEASFAPVTSRKP